MNQKQEERFSGPVTVFHERRLPERGTPAGYAALIDAYNLPVPIPRTLSAIGTRHKVIEREGWRLYTPRHAPPATLDGHLTFALKYEGLDLAALKRLFLAVRPADIKDLVRATPTGSYARRIWFLYEWLTGRQLDLPSAERGVAYVPAVDPEQQWAIGGENSARHRVRNNLPGTPDFCPLVFRTQALDEFIAMNMAERARGRQRRAAGSARANRHVFIAQGLEVELRDRGRTPAAGPYTALGQGDWRGGARPSGS